MNDGRAAAQGAPNVVQQRVHFLGGEGEQRRQRFLAFHPISCSTRINWAESPVRVAPNEYVAEHA